MSKLEVQYNKEGKVYSPIRDKYLIETPEEKVRQEFICKLVNEYGYSLEQMDEEVKLTSSLRGTGKASADLVVWKTKEEKQENKTAFLVIEFKAENLTLKVEDCYQGYNYATWSRAKLFAITNGVELQVYKTVDNELPLKLQPVNEIPNCKDIQDENKLKKILEKTKEFKGDEFATLLHKCHNILRNNDSLSPEAAFDEISKILFIKIMYERNPKEESIFSLKQFEKLKEAWKLSKGKSEVETSYMNRLFEDVKAEFKDDEIFEENEKIKIRETSFESIVRELQIYNLTSTSADVKGIAFEKFLGDTFRGELGQFFTPRTVVDFIVDLLSPEENELICDPCAGSGGFLIKVFENIQKKIEDEIIKQKKDKEKEIFKDNPEDENLKKQYDNFLAEKNKEEEQRIKKLSTESIFGTDSNPRMARVSKMNMIMHGDGHTGIHHNNGLLNINGIFRNRFDVIVTNPPFGTTLGKKDPNVENDDRYNNQGIIEKYKSIYGEKYEEEQKQVTENIGKPIRDLFKVGQTSGATEVLFVERCLDLLKAGGRMGIVLPEGVLNSSTLEKARDYFLSRAKILLIVSLPQEVFKSSGATVKTSLLFLKKFSEKEKEEYKKIVEEVKQEVENKYKSEIEKKEKEIKETKKDKEKKKQLQKELKEINLKKEDEIKQKVKQKFSYQIPISNIKKAGITTTGKEGENELPILLESFNQYRKGKNLW